MDALRGFYSTVKRLEKAGISDLRVSQTDIGLCCAETSGKFLSFTLGKTTSYIP